MIKYKIVNFRLNKTDDPKIKLLHIELNFPHLSVSEFASSFYDPTYGIFQKYFIKKDFLVLMHYCIGYCYADELELNDPNYKTGILLLLFENPLIKNSKCFFHYGKTIKIIEKPTINYKKPLISKVEKKYKK